MSSVRCGVRGSGQHFRAVIRELTVRGKVFSMSSVMRHFHGRSMGSSLFVFVRGLVTLCGGRKRREADRACLDALGDVGQFGGNGSVRLVSVSGRLVVSCRRCLGARNIRRGAVSFCVRHLHTICGGTISRRLVRRGCPFGRVGVKVRGAVGHTVPVGCVGELGTLRLGRFSSGSLTHSVFLFDFCAQNVSFVSVTCLRGDSLGGKALSCEQGGANRGLCVG